MKICSKCGIPKLLTEFHKCSKHKDGLRSECKECIKGMTKEYRQTDNGKAVHLREVKKYLKTKAGKITSMKSVKNYRLNNPLKYKAHTIVTHALRDGKLIRQPCEVCGNPKSEFHHPDYSKSLEGNWLCYRDHKLIHRILKILKEFGYIYIIMNSGKMLNKENIIWQGH